LGRSCDQHRPAALATVDRGLSQHGPHHRAAPAAAAGASADTSALADLLKSFSAGLNGFGDAAFANFVAQAGWFEVFDDRPFSGFLL
jgi:hypothetical protein